jgi:hypothetical protein
MTRAVSAVAARNVNRLTPTLTRRRNSSLADDGQQRRPGEETQDSEDFDHALARIVRNP